MRSMQGLRAAPGIARGPWVRIERSAAASGRRIEASEIEPERGRLRGATAEAAAELDAIAARIAAEGHPDEAAIFSAQAAIARDPALADLANTSIGDLHDAIGAIQAAGTTIAGQLRDLGDEILAARSADVVDVVDRIAGRLAGRSGEPAAGLAVSAIVVAEDLPPSITATLPRDRLLGIALEGSSATAHAAILARAYGIPAVVGVAGLIEALARNGSGPATSGPGTSGPRIPGPARELAIDGDTGEVVIDPDEATGRRFAEGAAVARRRRASDIGEATLPAVTRDGVMVELLANIGTPPEKDVALEMGAHGVGLFRTEFLFLERPGPPSEEEQLAAYRSIVEAFAPHPVTIRLLDIGGDKPIPWLPIAPEANPFLGVRALRLAHTDPQVFVTQLRACFRAAVAGPVKVMAPMVADAGDVDLLLDLAERARTGLATEGLESGEVALGVMLEIPSAILVGDSFFSRLAFASLGTNDLLQYTLAVDRGNAALERYRDAFHPALLRLIGDAVRTAARAGIELSVCGEMAGDPVAALALVGLGLRSLSMTASSIAAVRRAIRGATATELARLAESALSDPSARVARDRFAALAGPATPT